MFYRKTKAKVCSFDGDTDFFDIVVGVLQSYIFAPFVYNLSRLRPSNVDRSNKRKWLCTKKAKSR